MAHKKEYKETILFMISDASSYMNGFTMVVDGGDATLTPATLSGGTTTVSYTHLTLPTKRIV